MQKLFIISNESIYENNNEYFCDNIDLKSTPEGLGKNFEIVLIARKSNISCFYWSTFNVAENIISHSFFSSDSFSIFNPPRRRKEKSNFYIMDKGYP